MSPLRRALVFGASGQIGRSLLPLLREHAIEVLAVSRQPRAAIDAAGVRWLRIDLHGDADPVPAACDVVFSAGPLDAFARWQSRVGVIAPCVIAFGSTSASTKRASPDAAERDVAQRLGAAEDALFAFGAQHDVNITLLRPTLIYGPGGDGSLTRIASIAQRWGVFMLPRSAVGLRAPVHADDLAAAALACAQCDLSAGRSYDLPGGEMLAYDQMVARVLGALRPRPRLLRLPGPLFGAVLGLARRSGAVGGIGTGVLQRMDTDLVCDAAAARRDFGYAPRAFHPTADMFAQAPPTRGD